MTDLKPCPFCGGVAKVNRPMGDRILSKTPPFYGPSWYNGVCADPVCPTWGKSFPDLESAIEAWNTRAPDPRDEVIARLVEAATPFVSTIQDADYGRQLREYEALVSAIAAAKAVIK